MDQETVQEAAGCAVLALRGLTYLGVALGASWLVAEALRWLSAGQAMVVMGR